MSNDLELRMRFTADNKDVVGKTRDTRQAVKGLTNDLSGMSGAARSTAGGMAAATTAGQEATRMFRLQKGALQQAGYQFQDLAVQVGSGTSAFVAIGQQGSQLLGILGPGGALLGAVLAIGSVLAGAFYSGATKAADGVESLKDRIKELELGYKDLTSAQKAYLGLQAAERQSFFESRIEEEEAKLRKLQETIETFQNGGIRVKSTGATAGGGILGVDDAIASVTPEQYAEAQEALVAVNAEIDTLKQEAKDAAEQYSNLLFGFDESEESAENARSKIDELVKALKEQAAAVGETARQTDLRIASELGANDAQIQAINLAYDAIEAEQDRQEKLKKTNAATQEYERSLAALQARLDPVGESFSQFAEDAALLEKALLAGDISPDRYKDLLDNLVQSFSNAGDESGADFAEKVEKQMSAAGERVASSLQNAITSGDWDGIGASIGGALAGAIGGMVTDALTEQMAGQAAAGIFGPIAGAIAGGIAGLAVNKIGDWLSGDDWDPTEDRQARQGTGTVLGDINAKSESIRRAVEASEEGIGQLVGINQGMLRALQTLQLGIGGASAMVARQRAGMEFSAPGKLTRGQQSAAGLASLVTFGSAGIFGEILAPAFEAIDGVLGGALTDAAEFLDDLTFGLLSSIGSSVFGGDQKVVDEGIRIIGGNINDLVNRTLVQAYATIKEDGGWFSSDKRFDRFQNIATNQFSLAFESIYNAVEQSAGALGIDANRRLANFTVRTQRISLEDLSAAEQQAELEAYFSTVFDDLAGAAVPFLEDFQRAGEGLGETLARVANETMVTEEAVRRLGLNLADLSGRELVRASERLVEAAGGMEQFIGSMESFIGKFATDAQQFVLVSSDLTRALEQQGLAVPKTRQDYWSLLQAQDAATESGAENIATLLRLQNVADEYYTALEDGTNRAIQLQRDELASALGVAEQAANSVRSAIEGLNRSAGEFSGTARAAAEDYLRGLVRTGSVQPGRELDAALSSVTDIRADQFSSFNDYITEVASTGRLLADLDQITQAQVSVEQQMLDRLDRQAELLERGNAEQLAALIKIQNSVDRNTQALQFSVGSTGTGGVSGANVIERSNREVTHELRRMREEMLASDRALERHSERTARVLERIEREGLEVRS